LFGPIGVGKSHLATAIGYEAIKLGLTVTSVVARPLTGLLAARSDGAHGRLMGECNLPNINDFGQPAHRAGRRRSLCDHPRPLRLGNIIVTSNRVLADGTDLRRSTVTAHTGANNGTDTAAQAQSFTTSARLCNASNVVLEATYKRLSFSMLSLPTADKAVILLNHLCHVAIIYCHFVSFTNVKLLRWRPVKKLRPSSMRVS
jgi:hypothetical protein